MAASPHMADAIATFPVNCPSMWRTPSFNVGRIEAYGQLRTFISRDHFRSRITTVQHALKRIHPFPWVEFASVAAGVLFLLLLVAMSIIIARIDLFSWGYIAIPAFALLVLIAGSVFLLLRLSSQERERIDKLGPTLLSLLNEFNRNDIRTYEIKWMLFKRSSDQPTHDYVIQIKQIDIEVEVEALPAYDAAVILIDPHHRDPIPDIRSSAAIPPKYDALEMKAFGQYRSIDVERFNDAGTSRLNDDEEDREGAGTSGRPDVPTIVVVPPTHPPMVEVGDYDDFYVNNNYLTVPSARALRAAKRIEDALPYTATKTNAQAPQHGEAPPDYEMAVADGDDGRLDAVRIVIREFD